MLREDLELNVCSGLVESCVEGSDERLDVICSDVQEEVDRVQKVQELPGGRVKVHISALVAFFNRMPLLEAGVDPRETGPIVGDFFQLAELCFGRDEVWNEALPLLPPKLVQRLVDLNPELRDLTDPGVTEALQFTEDEVVRLSKEELGIVRLDRFKKWRDGLYERVGKEWLELRVK